MLDCMNPFEPQPGNLIRLAEGHAFHRLTQLPPDLLRRGDSLARSTLTEVDVTEAGLTPYNGPRALPSRPVPRRGNIPMTPDEALDRAAPVSLNAEGRVRRFFRFIHVRTRYWRQRVIAMRTMPKYCIATRLRLEPL